ncbi:hypothetical protein POPTR_012G025351v4 [Populus trichocarpa]|uniref:Uncharacterized protein n=1 Tax=Populus trichocarpa TaxID=3694 RepID=A0ACC0S3V0_POPTR|nr:hypothetical protein POPTR_012G025351v4 [Populus trichocarpa]
MNQMMRWNHGYNCPSQPHVSPKGGGATNLDQVFARTSAALTCLVLFARLRKPDPNHEASKKALEHKKEIDKRLGHSLIQTNPYEGCMCVKSIGGLESIKQALYELVILPLRKPELFSHGKLLGTGKTMLAKAIVRESGVIFINTRISNLISKWFDDAQKLGDAVVFSLAYKLQPAFILIDEVDSFLGQRRTTDHEALTNMKTKFMALWNGFTIDQNAQEMKIESKIDFDYIASLCESYTSSDFLEPCKKAPRPLSQSDLQRVLGTSTKTRVAANEYSSSSSHSPRWPVSQILNLQSDNQDP